ncbi:hypothetical protein PYCCODRAFT_136747 [Trametes coccinea BRFM310]|uniref:Uncharacterized protein n=1 Tax=Trametes coccinea (strain BRFM310) TaxID=1353009 RepID=A0A1Y2IT32_TRAC3|nr:hypothetical protein PYCCODRAFT_136747 [Trametes coccinea BRFM310]
MATVDRDRIAAATSRRVHTWRGLLYTSHDSEWAARQEFRKRVDRDILATNSSREAIESLEAVLRLAENILAEPDVPKFRRFRVRNDCIKRLIVQPKGVLQLVVATDRSKSRGHASDYRQQNTRSIPPRGLLRRAARSQHCSGARDSVVRTLVRR